MNQENKVVKISDVVQNQIPEFILTENPNFVEFLKQYYISQEFQGSSIDLAENLISYKNIDSFDNSNLISGTTLSSNVEFFDDVINVESTAGWPKEYGLLKIDDEIITYTGITSTTFTGCIRGFSGTSSLTQENNPEFLVFSQTELDSHSSGTVVENLSNLFLKEFFRKVKYQFTPGFEELDFAPQINPQNFISKVRSFYQTKGTDEAFKILFKVLYGENVKVINPDNYCFTPSDDKWRVVETFVCELISGDPLKVKGQTLYQDNFPQYNINNADGSIYNVESFVKEGQTFYKLQIFSGYSNNLNPRGSIQGTFVATPKTFAVEDITSGSTVLTVDSTVGFSNSGILEVNGLTITYTDKTNNQFLGCSGITSNITKKTKVFSDHYIYSYEEFTENVVKFKLCNVLSKLTDNNVLFAYDGDPIQIDHLGSTENSIFSSSLIYNIPTSIFSGVAVNSITTQIRNNQKQAFSISNGVSLCKSPHYLRSGDIVDLYIANTNQLIASNLVVTVLNSNEFSVPVVLQFDQLLKKQILFKRSLKKAPYNGLNFTANIQDSYVSNDSYYLTSNGLPEYQIQPLTFDQSFYVNINYYLDTTGNHYFHTGDEVTVVDYSTTQNYKNQIGIDTGKSYYINRVNNFQIQLAQSRENIGVSSFIPFIEYNNSSESGRVTNVSLVPTSQYNQDFNSTKLFKKFIKEPKLSITKSDTKPGSLGVFINGVELRNYKSFDKIYYGSIDSLTILSSGSNYDLNNPPQFNVSGGSNTTIIPELKGKLTKLSVIDPGFDYIEVPTVKVLGGNNFNSVTEVKMKNIINQIDFNSSTKDTVVDTVNNQFKFKSPHKFITGEPVLYKTFGSTPIGIGTTPLDGFLIDNSVYYVVNVGAGTSMSLAFNKNDAMLETNIINLRTYGGGLQSFISTSPKKAVDEVNIIQNQGEFQYKKVSFISKDINLQDNIIKVENHGFSTGEEVIYDWEPTSGFNGASIGGLEKNTYYYIVKIDKDSFKLSSTKNEINIIDLTSKESYTTYFIEYSPIRIEIEGTTSVNGLSPIGYEATILPIVEGSVVSASVQRKPSIKVDIFGNKNILNYEEDPEITVIEGEGASLQPLIINGQITQVIIKNSGKNYYNSFDLIVNGEGFGAKLQPIINQGSIIDVKIVNGGVGYASTNTNINIVPTGKNVRLKANITSYYVNDINKQGLSNVEDGAIFGKNYSSTGNTYGVYFLNTKLKNFFNIPNSPTQHSPIIGWSYDGCPIYGPYAYTNADGTGGISRMRSGYTYQNIVGSIYNLIEEYQFTNNGTLDKYNGRFCATPEYPNGVYAYFCTLDNNNVPEFPYVIGPQYNFTPIEENFDLKNNQTINFNNLDIVKWTSSYRVEDNAYKYEYFEFFKNVNENDVIVEKSSSGTIDEIQILDGGLDYQVNDSLVFDDEGTSGFGALAKVSEVLGADITNISTENVTIPNVTFVSDGSTIVGIASTYHTLKNDSYVNISDISTSTFKSLEGFRKINVANIFTTLAANVGPSSITGIVTSIQVNEPITSFEVDSQLLINNELVKVIGLDYKNNLLNILRDTNSPSHVQFESIQLLQNKFKIFAENLIPSYSEINNSYYFNSQNSVCLGTDISVGIGNTLTIYPLGIGVPYIKYVQTGGIYLPGNKFNSGDKIKYTPGASTIVTNKGNLNSFSDLYIIKLTSDVIGIVTSKTDISNTSNILTYVSRGSGDLHNFVTDRQIVKGTVTNNSCVVSTASTHGLSTGNLIRLNVVSGITTTYSVSYSNNRILINSEVNPKINVYANDTVIFDLSDISLVGKTFNLYTDSGFLNQYYGNMDNGFEVTKTQTQLTLKISKYTPRKLYYNLSETISDITISNYNQLEINNSLYNTDSIITNYTDYSFTFNLKNTPERLFYTNISNLSYSVLSQGVLGSIFKVELISKGSNYKKLPSIKSVLSSYGNGCNLFANSYSIGKIEKAKVNNTQLITPFDKTLKPESNVFSSIKLTDNFTVDSLDILFTGQNYITQPKIQLYNYTEDKIIPNFSAEATLKNNSIDQIILINPGYGLKSNDNQIIVTNNDNGFRILNAFVSGLNPYIVTLTLQTPISGFTTSNPLPISIGDKIFVEGIISNGNGFNSSDYKYEPFAVTFVDPAYGSQDSAIIRYQLNENPGSFDSFNTYNAYATPYSYIPKIKVNLKQNNFYNKEYVNNVQIINNPKNNPITNLVKIKNISDFEIGDIIIGKSSNSKGKIVEIDNFKTKFISDCSVSELLGGEENRGYLSSNIQKLSDNDYYQKFSYSLKSNKSFVDWNSPVSDISHISGYKKFSDLSIESVGIGTTQPIKTDSTSTLNVVLDSYVNVNSISNYDLVNEIDIEDTNGLYSQYLRFERLNLGQSLKSTNNRVLSIDDISSLFNNQEITPKINLDSIFTSETTALKYQFYLTSTNTFLGEFIYPEIFELFVTRNLSNINLTSYSYYYDLITLGPNAFFGTFSADVSTTNNNQIVLSFQPTNSFISVDIKAIKETAPNTVGIATTSFGYVKNVEICEQYSAGIGTTVFYSIPTSQCNSGTLIVGLSSTANSIEKCFESSFVNTPTNLLISRYSENVLNDLGDVNVQVNGPNIEFNYTGVGIGVTVQANIKLLTNDYAGYDTIYKTFSKISSSRVITNSSSTGVSTISGTYGYSKYIIEISQNTGITTNRSIVQLNSIHAGNYLNNILYNINGNISLDDLIFETDYNIIGNNYTLYFNPVTSANYTIIIYESSLLSPKQ